MKLKKLLLSVCALATSASIVSHYSFNFKASAEVNNQLNIRVYMDKTMYHDFHDYLNSSNPAYGTYGVPSSFTTRMNNIEAYVHSYYRSQDIYINIITEDITPPRRSAATICVENCYTNGIDSYGNLIANGCPCRGDGITGFMNCTQGEYHHTHVDYFFNTLPYHDPSSECALLLTSSPLCYTIDNETHMILDGICRKYNMEIISRDYDFLYDHGSYSPYSYARFTFVHEVGHLFDVADHYDTKLNSTADRCVWGYYGQNIDVASSCYTCSTCHNTLIQNKDRYQHT